MYNVYKCGPNVEMMLMASFFYIMCLAHTALLVCKHVLSCNPLITCALIISKAYAANGTPARYSVLHLTYCQGKVTNTYMYVHHDGHLIAYTCTFTYTCKSLSLPGQF